MPISRVLLLQVLKQKKLYETQRDQLYNQQFNVEQTAFVMENVQDSVQTVQAMKAASKELRIAFKKNELNISGIEKLQDDMADLMASETVCTTALHSRAVSIISGDSDCPVLRTDRTCTTISRMCWVRTMAYLTTLMRTI